MCGAPWRAFLTNSDSMAPKHLDFWTPFLQTLVVATLRCMFGLGLVFTLLPVFRQQFSLVCKAFSDVSCFPKAWAFTLTAKVVEICVPPGTPGRSSYSALHKGAVPQQCRRAALQRRMSGLLIVSASHGLVWCAIDIINLERL